MEDYDFLSNNSCNKSNKIMRHNNETLNEKQNTHIHSIKVRSNIEF